MTKRTKQNKRNNNKAANRKTRRYVRRRVEVYSILLIMLSILLFISVFVPSSAGLVNESVNNLLSHIFGVGKYLIPILLLIWGISFFIKRIRYLPSRFGWGFFLLFFSVLGILSNDLNYENIFDDILVSTRGGITGAWIFYGLSRLFGNAGSITILSVFIIISILIIFKISMIDLARKFFNLFRKIDLGSFKELLGKDKADEFVPSKKTIPLGERKAGTRLLPEKNKVLEKEPEVIDGTSRTGRHRSSGLESSFGTSEPEMASGSQLKIPILKSDDKEDESYRVPPLSLLKKSKSVPAKLYKQSVKERVATLNKLFNDFNLPAKVRKVIRGPSITLYELVLSPGVKVQRLFSLEDDFCVALGSPDIRILAPIPGKSAIGIEVPNKIRSIVTLGDIYSQEDRNISEKLLNVPMGKNLSGEIVYMDIETMPHVLIAGATNSGKSSCLSSIIISLLLKAKPSEVKFIMVDPKMVELSIYNNIPHLLTPVVVDPKKAASALAWAIEEMGSRLKLLSERNIKSLKEYNLEARKAAAGSESGRDEDFKPLPYIVIVLDELADLMMVAASEVEDSICRVAQMGRAVGIHLLISTQRPSVNVITGVIKANIPSRVSFMVTSNVDSRVILDCSGADKLIGKGDMLYLPYYSNKPERLQGSFVTTKEIEMITGYVKGEKKAEYNLQISEKINKSTDNDSEEDDLFFEAMKIAVDFGRTSASLLQRRLKIGYSRAARIIDQLEGRGYISGPDGSKPRDILISRDDLIDIMGKKENK